MSKPIARKRSRYVADKKPKSQLHTFKTLLLIKKGMYANQIARQLNVPRQTINSRIKSLLNSGLIKLDLKTSATFYVLTKKGYQQMKSFRSRLSRYPRQIGKTRLHRLNIKFPIVKDNPHAKFEKEYQLNNWIQSYTTVKFPIGITIKRTPKNIIAMFHEYETRKASMLTDFFTHIMRGSYYVYYFLMNRYKIQIDLSDLEVTDQHIVNERPDLKGKVDDKKTTTIALKRAAKSILPAKFGARTWIDQSRGLPEVETNDFLYEERLLMMPETVDKMGRDIVPAIEDLTKQINLHLEVQRETLKTLKKMQKKMK